MSKQHRLLKDLLILGSLTAAGIYAVNRFLIAQAGRLNLLEPEKGDYYLSSVGDVYYKTAGIGKKPLLLIHNLKSHASANEWNQLIDHLKYDYTIYTLDLPGCGRSDKPALTYTNYMYVELLSSFIRDVIGDEKVTVCCSGFSGSIGVMLAKCHADQVSDLFMINPTSLKKLDRTPDFRSKLLQLAVNTPIIGTAIYNIYNSRRNLEFIIDESWYNPFHIQDKYVLECYEAAHYDHCGGKHLQASLDGHFVNWNIRRALSELSIPVTILIGAKAASALKIAEEYHKYCEQITIEEISASKMMPHLENTEMTSSVILKNS